MIKSNGWDLFYVLISVWTETVRKNQCISPLFEYVGKVQSKFCCNRATEVSCWCYKTWDALHNLMPFVQFKKHEKHPWKNVTFTKSSTPPWVFFMFKKGVLKSSVKFTGKHLCQSLFFNKVIGLRAATLLKKRLWHRCFNMNFAKFLRTPFFIEHLCWLLLILS